MSTVVEVTHGGISSGTTISTAPHLHAPSPPRRQDAERTHHHPASPSPPLPDAPPPPPNPASDPRLAAHEHSDSSDVETPSPPPSSLPAAADSGKTPLSGLSDDIFAVPASAAVRLLGASVEALVHMTGDIPPAPPPDRPETPHMRGIEVEKRNIVRSHSERTLARLRLQAEAASRAAKATSAATSAPPTSQSKVDGVKLRGGLPPGGLLALAARQGATPPPTPEPYTVVGANSQPVNVQHSAITRKFYSKKPPPIGIGDYLLRLHRFCPASTAVYLATSLYIHRLAVDERAIAVTRRNAHRLLLAGLRVAMKALEDRCYPHARVAQVGGVSAAELARLEISFCFLAGFELVVSPDAMRRHWAVMRAPLSPLSPVQFGDGDPYHHALAGAPVGSATDEGVTADVGSDASLEMSMHRRSKS